MINGLRLIYVSLISLVFLSCTQSGSPETASHSDSSSRDIASVRRGSVKLKKVKILRKGFYIDSRSLRVLSMRNRASYYGIFANAAMNYEFLLGKSRVASNDNGLFELRELFVPKADAAPCPSSMYVMDNGQSDCTKANSFFRPEDSKDWDKYKPVGGLLDSVESCTNDGNRMSCPAIGVAIRNDVKTGTPSAMVMCSSDSQGLSSSCKKEYEEGIPNTVKLLEECDTNNTFQGKPKSARNVSCEDLKSSVQRAIQMFNDNCKESKFPKANNARRMMRNICSDVQSAVNGVARKIGEAVNPVTAETLPNVETCNHLGDGVESNVSKMDMSPQWKALMNISRGACDNLKGKDINTAALKFGKCSKSLPGSSERQLKTLLDNYENGHKNPPYIKQFMAQFGLAPSRYQELFCKSNDITDFSRAIRDDMDEHTTLSEDLLLDILDYDQAQPLGISEAQFNDLKKWAEENMREMKANAASLGGQANISDALENVSASDAAMAKKAVSKALADGVNDQYSWDQLFKLSLQDKKFNNSRIIAIRAAISNELRARLMSPAMSEQIQNARKWLASCVAEVKKIGPTKEVKGGTFTPDQANFKGCQYRKETDITSYFENKEGKPYVVYNTKTKKCYEEYGKVDVDTSNDAGNELTVRSINIRNPLSHADAKEDLVMNNSNFDVGDEASRGNDYVLYRYQCTDDIEDVENPFSGDDNSITW